MLPITFCSQIFANLKVNVYLCSEFKYLQIMEVAINSKLYQQALTYAKQQGLSLTTVIEDFLVRFVGHNKAAEEQAVPDIVLSLLGAGEPVSEDDLNAREAYNQYLEEKYK